VAEQDTTATQAVYVRLTKGDVATTRQVVADDVVVDYDATGRVLGVEILGAESVTIDGFPAWPVPETDDEVRGEWAAWDPTHTNDPNDEAARTRRLKDKADAEDYVLMPAARRNRIAYRSVTYSRWVGLPGMEGSRE
jgi:uncharacterized protein YuzE